MLERQRPVALACPKCRHDESFVIDTRAGARNTTVRRRRECGNCEHRFTTYEAIQTPIDVKAAYAQLQRLADELRALLTAVTITLDAQTIAEEVGGGDRPRPA